MLSAFLIICFVGVQGDRQPDIDINRVHQLPREESRFNYPFKSAKYVEHEQQISRNNDYDYNSRGVGWSQPSLSNLHDASVSSGTKIPIKTHQPREDPRLFYQSDAYLKEVNRQNIDYEVASVYPGREVVRAGEKFAFKSLPLRMSGGQPNRIPNEDFNICVRCPHDRTLIAKAGSRRVVLQDPRLVTCSGRKAPRNVQFDHMYGPKFGSLIEQGSHMIVGRITHNSQVLQLCKMQVHVLIQGCPVPKYLISSCGDTDKSCNFTCRDPKSELHGESTLICQKDLKWKGDLPICKARTWCEPPPPPTNGHLSCQGATVGNTSALVEGSKCRVRCARGWRWIPRAAAVCRRGSWTHGLMCTPKRSTKTMNF